MSAAGHRRAELFLVSDGTGDTAAATAAAALSQFHVAPRVRRFRDVRQPAQAQRIVEMAQRSGALIVYTLVGHSVSRALRDGAAERGVPAVDLLGPLIARIAQHLRAQPRLEPGLLHGYSDEYIRRIEAVEYAVRHDDGANLDTLHEADLVLVGVSRSSKTPLTMYLAQRGYRTANVPIVPGLAPPRALLELDPRRVFGLTIAPDLLLTVRRARARRGLPRSHYTDQDRIAAELDDARSLFRRHGWRVIDISGRAVEENAATILDRLEEGLWAGATGSET